MKGFNSFYDENKLCTHVSKLIMKRLPVTQLVLLKIYEALKEKEVLRWIPSLLSIPSLARQKHKLGIPNASLLKSIKIIFQLSDVITFSSIPPREEEDRRVTWLVTSVLPYCLLFCMIVSHCDSPCLTQIILYQANPQQTRTEHSLCAVPCIPTELSCLLAK